MAMTLDDLPEADLETLAAHEEAGEWVMIAMHGDLADRPQLEDLLPDEESDPSTSNYAWYRADAAGEVAEHLAERFEIEPATQLVILSPYAGVPDFWVLDELDGRFPEDVLQFMDDHAGAIELEDDPEHGRDA